MKKRLVRRTPEMQNGKIEQPSPGAAKRRLRLLSDCAFAGGIILILLVGLVKTLCLPDAISEYENRYAEQVDRPTVVSWLDGSFQADMDNALGDQVHFSSSLKRLYNRLNTGIQNLTGGAFLKENDYFRKHYLRLDGTQFFGTETLVYSPYPQTELSRLDAKIDDYNTVFAALPDTEFFLYYIEKDTDLNLETGEKVPFYAKLRDKLQLPAENMACFEISSFEDFSSYFYKTDHHWDYRGSYKGYGEVMALLGCEDALLQPAETVTTMGQFSGSKAKMSGSTYAEQFVAYRFDFPAMEITIKGQPAPDYGHQAEYLSGAWSAPDYALFYGGDDGEIIFDTNRPERENLLIIGESYDNAILKLIATHYNRTHSIDLRYYENDMGEKFSLTDYLQENEIEKVLLIGNVDYYLGSTFTLGG